MSSREASGATSSRRYNSSVRRGGSSLICLIKPEWDLDRLFLAAVYSKRLGSACRPSAHDHLDGRRTLTMLMRTDPFRDLDRLLSQQVFGTVNRPAAMPMDAYRKGHEFYVHLDLPGINPDSIDLTVEQNVLTVKAERTGSVSDEVEMIVSERPTGTFSRQLFLGETLDADRVAADYSAGVLTPTIPVRESAKPRKLSVTTSDTGKQIATAS